MRYDLKIMWVEDTPDFFEETKDILEMYAEDNGIALSFDYIDNVKNFLERMRYDMEGFKVYDIFFIDYTLSSSVYGSELIKKLRKEKMDSDILFYSSEHETDIREIVINDLGSFEGVYIANRINFEDKSNYLINKNARRLTSLANIRGFLMDQTSENDYTMKSYIYNKFDLLTSEQKNEIKEMILDFMKEKLNLIDSKAATEISYLENNGIKSISRVMGILNDLFPIEMKYKVFQKMIEFNRETQFQDVTLQMYIDEIIKARNNLAHKKLDVCRKQKYILYYDNKKQFDARQCPIDCEEHIDENKYSIKEWNDIRKNVIKFGKDIDKLQKKL
ncbi:hypothetical protein [Traorella massiliensis]|uniref:hypothetical protein n=1 Tax=Traorella massiliensis TaxID=1903263 RepID=UPI002355586E|nr:hypothetical protein [Traorella massiliensis]